MRFALVLALAFAAMPIFGEDSAPAKTAESKATNTVCPLDGKPIDKSVAPIAGKTTDGKDVAIGTCCENCQAKIKANPTKFADAAAKDGTVEPKK